MDGKSDFASVLDELIRQREEIEPPHISGIDYLNVVEELHSGRIQFAGDEIELVYREHMNTPSQPAQERPPVDVPPPSLEPGEIGRELGMAKARSEADLDAARRRFAFANHPDRVAPDLRERAERRMQIANMLIDEAKRANASRKKWWGA